MKESLELRVYKEFSELVFSADEGKDLGSSSVRKFTFLPNDIIMAKIKRVEEKLRKTQNKFFFSSWQYTRSYSNEELNKAELFQLFITAYFETQTEHCGSVYDYSNVCTHCGVGRQLIGDLILELGKIPKNKDFAQTIARDEWIISERLMRLMIDNNIKGASFNKVVSKNRRYVSKSNWYHLIIISPEVEATFPTRFGNDPFDDDKQGLYRCPVGHIEGLNILSELNIKKDTYKHLYDIAVTRQHVGRLMGKIMPSPLIVISPRFRDLLVSNNIKGFKTEVAYLAE
jgi:hypothetical protein